jgi:hypothetical protein
VWEETNVRMSEHESGEATLRPKAARLDDEPDPRFLHAAATGRHEVLGPSAVLGLQRAVGNAGTSAALEDERSPVHGVVNSGGGTPLAPDVREDMEARLGHDFGDVRVHTDGAAHESAKAVNAHAYTVGSNVVFQRDKYDPGSAAGKTMLAHELTHVTQQRSGAVDGTPAPGGIRVSDPSDRFEREATATAEAAVSGPVPATPVATGVSAVQRQEAQEEEVQTFVQREDAPAEEEQDAPVQGTFVQREDAPAEDEEDAPA